MLSDVCKSEGELNAAIRSGVIGGFPFRRNDFVRVVGLAVLRRTSASAEESVV